MAEAHGHSLLHHHFDDLEQQRETNLLGMWTFLATELLMFSGLFFTYTLYRWTYPAAYEAGSHRLNFTLGFINTMVLLVSSLTAASAVYNAHMRNRKALVACLVATWILGATFIGVKGKEWSDDYKEGIVPSLNWNPEPQRKDGGTDSPGTLHNMELFFCVYFMMTGLHAFHMIIGLGVVGWMTYLAAKGMFTDQDNAQPIEIVGLYWHFVDIVWVFLFPLLYLIVIPHGP